MERSSTPQSSRLLLRLALAVADCKYPDPQGSRRVQTKGAEERSEEKGRDAEEQSDALPEGAWERLENLRFRFGSELSFADSCLADDPPSSRIELLLANSSELRKVAVLQRFLERAYSLRLQSPGDGLQISDDIIAWTKNDSSPLVSVIRGRAWMERGNFLRILGDAKGAYASLEEALQELETHGVSDSLELARYQELLGTLERDCGNFTAAADLLKKALAKVRRWGDSYSLQRVLIAASITDVCCNNFEEAQALLDDSLRIDVPDSLLLRYAAVNKILAYYLSGNPQKAYQALLRVRSGLGSAWLQGFSEVNRTTILWSEGQMLSALRIDDEAVGLLSKAREFFVRSSQGSKVCHISVDLALSYVAQQRFGDVRRELAFGLPFCSEESVLDQNAKEALLLLLGALEHQGRLEGEHVRAVNDRLAFLHRAPLQTLHKRPFADLRL